MEPPEAALRRKIARLNARAWGVAGGLTLGLLLFVATNVLLIAGPAPGMEVGETLGQLGYYLPGYSVTFAGSLLGLVYGFLIGYAMGHALGSTYNRLVGPWK